MAKCYRLLRSILNTPVEDELLQANPCRIRNGGVERSKERQILTKHLVDHVDDDAEALVFTNSYGQPIRSSIWDKAWRDMRRSTGYTEVRPHDLRHLAGTLTAQDGATLSEIMARLGHSTTGAALRYQHVAADRLR